jgi:PAS domain S-box-containing protein
MQETLERLLTFTRDGICQHTFVDGKILRANQGLVDILDLNCKPEELTGKILSDVMICIDEPINTQELLERAGELHGSECHIRTVKGNEKWLVRDNILVTDPYSNQRVVECVVKDVTVTRQAERILHALVKGTAATVGDEFFRTLVMELASALQAHCVFVGELVPDNQNRIRTIAVCLDGKLADNFEYSLDGAPCSTVVGRGLCWYSDNVQKRFPKDDLLAKIGAVSYAAAPLFTVSNKPLGLLGVIHTHSMPESDHVKSILTIFAERAGVELERERAEEILRESEMRYRRLLASVTDYVYTVTIENGRPVSTTHGMGCEAVTGYTPQNYEADSDLWYRMIYEEDRPAVTKHANRILTEKEPLTLEHRLIHKNGSVHWVRNTLVPRHDDRGYLIAYDGIVADITERKRYEEEMMRLVAAVNAAAESVIITDPHGNILYVNPCFETMTGYTRDEIIGKNTRLLKSGKHNHAFYADLWSTIASGATWHGRFTNRKKDGTLFEEDATISPVRDSAGGIVNFVAVKRDVTQEVVLENELRHSQKMEAVGRLAGGIAHDFTNMLVVILNCAEMVKSHLPSDSSDQGHMDSIIEAANKSGKLSGQLLAFAHRQQISLRVTDLNRIIKSMEEMIRRTAKTDITVSVQRTKDPLLVKVDSAQIEQIIVHMVINAQDAMQNGGQITIETSRVFFSRSEAVQLQEAVNERASLAGGFASLSISDTGCGMTEEVRRRAFDPFFTTKGVGLSTGLGLSTCYGIIRQHGGLITVYSNQGLGSTFTIYLPLVDQVPVEIAEENELTGAEKGTETILVVEDDALVRKVLVGMLHQLGYSVLEAESGRQAIEIARQHGVTIQLLMTDVVMPETSGPTIAEIIRKMRPGIKVLLSSGYPKSHLKEHGVMKDMDILVNKPYFLGSVAHIIRELLNAPKPA